MSTNNRSPASCPKRATPEPDGLGLDRKSIFAVVPRENYTGDSPDDWMVSCCEPSPVQLVGNEEFGTCWQWCDLPSNYTNLTSDTSILSADFMRCITSTARATNSSYPPTALLLSAAPRASVAGDRTVNASVLHTGAEWGTVFTLWQARSDDARNNHTRWMWVKEPESGEDHLVEILLDTQSDGNFITEEMVNDYKLQLQRLPRPANFNMAVGEVTCQYRVSVEWMGADDAHDTTVFYVLPRKDCRVEKPLLGAASMAKFKHLLLEEPPKDSKYLMYTAMKKKTKDEEIRLNQSRQQAMEDRAKLAEKKKTHEDNKSEKGRKDGSSSKSKKG